jgi:hypothetical protein
VTQRELMEQRGEHLRQAGLDLAERASNQRTRRQRIASESAGMEQNGDSRSAAEAAEQRAVALEAALLRAGDEQQLRQRRGELLDGSRNCRASWRGPAGIARLERMKQPSRRSATAPGARYRVAGGAEGWG